MQNRDPDSSGACDVVTVEGKEGEKVSGFCLGGPAVATSRWLVEGGVPVSTSQRLVAAEGPRHGPWIPGFGGRSRCRVGGPRNPAPATRNHFFRHKSRRPRRGERLSLFLFLRTRTFRGGNSFMGWRGTGRRRGACRPHSRIGRIGRISPIGPIRAGEGQCRRRQASGSSLRAGLW